MQQYEAAYQAQKKAAETAQEQFNSAEKEFFLADRAINRYAEQLEDVLTAKQIIEESDKEKFVLSFFSP
jgi:hypothetical protein